MNDMPCMSCGVARSQPPRPEGCNQPNAHVTLCAVAACRGVVRTTTRVLEDGDPEPYGYCSTCGRPVTN